MKNRAEVVIIGGGIQGTSAAYHLANKGVRDIVLVEADMIGSGSSSRSAAMILLQMSRETTIRLSQEAFPEYLNFQDEFGVDSGYKPTGYLHVATRDVAEELKRQVDLQREMGVPSEILSPEDLKRLVPAVNLDDIVFGSICWKDGMIDPHSVMQAYVRQARQMGAQIEEKVEATSIVVENHRVVAVETTAGRIATSVVVNAAGPRARQVGEWVGLKLPITNYKRTIFVTKPFDAIPDNYPFVMDLAAEWYFRKEGKGILMGMGTEESSSYEPQLEWEFLDLMTQHALHRAPVLANARVMKGWAGLRPLTPDDCPLLGPVEGIEGYINDCGWGGHGVMHAPIGGRLTAEWIADGKASMALTPLLLSRFG